MSATSDPNPTREKILLTAQRLFHERGYSEVGINTLCHEAGVVKGSFYHFYSSKQELLEAVIQRNLDLLLDQLARQAEAGGSGRDRLLAHFSAIIATAASQKADRGRILGCAIGTLSSELAATNEPARVASAGAFRKWRELLERLLGQGIEDGSIARSVDPESTALAMLALIQGMSTLGRSFNDPDLLTEIAQITVKRLLPVRVL